MSEPRAVSSTEKHAPEDDKHLHTDSGGASGKQSGEKRDQNEKYALELEQAHTMSPEELRRLRRRISNRESARRLRKQRSEKLSTLVAEQDGLHAENETLMSQITATNTLLQRLHAENAAMKSRLGEDPADLHKLHLPNLPTPRTNAPTLSRVIDTLPGDTLTYGNSKPIHFSHPPKTPKPVPQCNTRTSVAPSQPNIEVFPSVSTVAAVNKINNPVSSTSVAAVATASIPTPPPPTSFMSSSLAATVVAPMSADVSQAIQDTLTKAGFDITNPSGVMTPIANPVANHVPATVATRLSSLITPSKPPHTAGALSRVGSHVSRMQKPLEVLQVNTAPPSQS